MARYGAARWEEIPENRTQSSIRPTQVILHVSAGESTDLFGYWTSPGVVLESHFYVTRAGVVEQYEDTTVMAEANLTANRRADGTGAISIETQGADANGIWEPAQLAALERLVRWACTTHGIPMRLCTGPAVPGIGWHVMWGAPGPWTPAVGKVCPGPARVQQIKTKLIPALANPEEVEDVALSPDDIDKIATAVWYKIATGLTDDAHPKVNLSALRNDVTDLGTKLNGLVLPVGAVNAAQVASAVCNEADKRAARRLAT